MSEDIDALKGHQKPKPPTVRAHCPSCGTDRDIADAGIMPWQAWRFCAQCQEFVLMTIQRRRP